MNTLMSVLGWIILVWQVLQGLMYFMGLLYVAWAWRRPPADPDEEARLIYRS